MTKNDFEQLVTVKDLQEFCKRITEQITKLFSEKAEINKEFYTPKEFSHITGIKYSTVIYYCKVGRLKARQDAPNSSWLIDVNEIKRLKNEANDFV